VLRIFGVNQNGASLPATLEGFTLKVAELQIGELLYSLPSILEGFTLKVAELQIGKFLYS
jgi:hypothetical protein